MSVFFETMNGYVNQDGITINVNSAKALNRVVGHEITHILERTDLYDSLAMAVAAYAKTKGEYESRLQQIRELYKNKEGYTGEDAEAKFQAELIADLVGDYIFTDKAFVEKLFQEEPGLFKRIFEEIKYLCKLVTAGSKEARQLEKCKKVFTEVVREASENGVKNPTGEGGVMLAMSQKENVANGENSWYNSNRGEEYARTDEFRDLQAESQRMSAEEWNFYLRGGENEVVRRRVSAILQGQMDSFRRSGGSYNGVLSLSGKGNQFNIYEGVSPSLFHDVFEVSRKYLRNGELVDLHDVETTEDHGIGYKYCDNYLSEDGLSGFSITPDGDLISVFNASEKGGFLRAISEVVKAKAKTLDCYASPNQNLMEMYQKVFGFKTASVMDYNMEYDHDNIAENHNMPKVAFMVNTDAKVDTREFTEQQYDEALAYRNSFLDYVNETSSKEGVFSISAPAQVEAVGGSWDVRGQDVGLPMPEGYQEGGTVAGTTQKGSTSAQTVREVGLPMPGEPARVQSDRADGNLTSPEAAVRAEQQSLDDEFRRQAGLEEDPSLYDPEEDEGVETTRDKLEIQKRNQEYELKENQRLRQEMIEDFDQKIEAKQAQYDGKKLKHSKTAQALLRDIEKLKRKKADRMAEYDRAIARIQSRMEKIDEKLQTGTPEKQDRLEKENKKARCSLTETSGFIFYWQPFAFLRA